MIAQFFSTLIGRIAGGIIAALLIIIAVLSWQLGRANDRAAKATAKAAVCEDRHAITRQSLKTLEADLARMLADGSAREARLADAARKQAEKNEVIQTEVARIIERTPPPKAAPPCRTPADILNSGAL